MPEEVAGEASLFLNDPANYRKLSEPFKSAEEADDALKGFAREVRELRNKYKLPDVYTIIRANSMLSDGEEGAFILILHNGSEDIAESMVAYAFGMEQQRRQERIAKSMGKAKTVKTRRDDSGK